MPFLNWKIDFEHHSGKREKWGDRDGRIAQDVLIIARTQIQSGVVYSKRDMGKGVCLKVCFGDVCVAGKRHMGRKRAVGMRKGAQIELADQLGVHGVKSVCAADCADQHGVLCLTEIRQRSERQSRRGEL